MSAPNDGGPAFPNIGDQPWNDSPGMMLRQWYKGRLAPMVLRDGRYGDVGNEAANVHEVARYSALLADALLAEDAAFAERAKGTQ